MQWINNLKLMPKLMLTFGVVLFVMLIQGIVAYKGLSSLDSVTTDLAQKRMESIRTAGELRGMVGEYRNAAYQGLIRASADVKADALKQSVEIRANIEEAIKAYPRLIDDPAERKLFDTFVADWEAALVSYDSVTECWSWNCPTTRWTPSSVRPATCIARRPPRWAR
jgi:hypothetical protein